MSSENITWIVPNGKTTYYAKLFSLILFIIGLIGYFFNHTDVLIGAMSAIVIMIIPFTLVIKQFMSYSFGITDEILYVKRNGKDYVSGLWEEIVTDGNVLLIDNIPINFKPYSGNDYGSTTYADIGYGYDYSDEEFITYLLPHLKKSKRISTPEMIERKKKEVFDLKTITLVTVMMLVFVVGYVYYSIQR